MRGARAVSRWRARRAPPFGSEFGRQWCLCTKLRVRRAFSTRKAVQGGAEGAWGLGSECCGQALRWRRVCAPVLRRQRCACERLTSRGVRGRVGFRFGRPVFWAGAGAEGAVGGRRRHPADRSWRGSGSRSPPAAAAAHHAVSSLGGGRSASGAQDPGRSIRAQRWSSRIGPDLASRAPRRAREDQAAAALHATEQNRHRDDASKASGRTCSTTPLGRLCRQTSLRHSECPGRTRRRRESEEGNAQQVLFRH